MSTVSTITSDTGASKMVSQMGPDRDKYETKTPSQTSGIVAFGASTISSAGKETAKTEVVSSSSSFSIDPSSTHSLSTSTVSGSSPDTPGLKYYTFLTIFRAGLKDARSVVKGAVEIAMNSPFRILYPSMDACYLSIAEGAIKEREELLNKGIEEFSKNRLGFVNASIKMLSLPEAVWNQEYLDWYKKYDFELTGIIEDINSESNELLQLRIKYGINAQTGIKFVQPPFIETPPQQ